MTRRVLVIGEILVEIMALERGEGFLEPLALTGPYPSGAPAIFIDQAARQGANAAMISRVGDDDFGRLNLTRLQQAGVDISAIVVDPEAVTGSAFVRYRPDGGRDFVFNIKDSASGRIALDPSARAAISAAGHLHVMGSSLGARGVVDCVLDALTDIRSRGGTVSFDPNIRKEILGLAGMRAALNTILASTDLFLPSGDELALFAGPGDPVAQARTLIATGIRAVVLKDGARGARYIDATSDIFVPAFAVEEIDPTGAGDAFGGTFVADWLAGLPAERALRRACAAGALAVTKRGPMEGNADRAAIDAFIAAHS